MIATAPDGHGAKQQTGEYTMIIYKTESFESKAKKIAEVRSEAEDPLIFEGIQINDGKKEAFFHDSKCVYYVDEDLDLNYASAR